MKISILLINFNKEMFLKKTIKSCICQSYNNFEIVIIDDQSTDNSWSILKKFNKKYKNIKLFYTKLKKSKSPAINHYKAIKYGLKKCSGKIICLLDGDDQFDKKKLYYVNNFFCKNKKARIVFNKPKFYINKKISYTKKSYKTRFNKWPYHPPLSCISIYKKSLLKVMSDYNNSNFSDTWLDFIISAVMHFQYEQFHLIDKNLTTYVITNRGWEKKLYAKFNLRWWMRRMQAHNFIDKIQKQIFYSKFISLDYIITKFYILCIKLKSFKFR